MSAVFVDNLVENGWNLGPNCHLFVKPETPLHVLHSFAATLGMRRKWFQHKPGKLPHYDLTRRRRSAAISLGAVPINRADTVSIIRMWKASQAADSPHSNRETERMNPHTIRRLFPRASASLLAANDHDSGTGIPDDNNTHNTRATAKPQQADRPRKLDGSPATQKANTGRVHIRVVSVRKRLCDPDNVVCKWLIDCLRYCSAIPDDTAEDITLEIAQRKVAKGEEEHTELAITYP